MATKVLTPDSIGGLEIAPVADKVVYINLFLYGDPGVGKTVLLGSASEIPEMSPMLLIDIEGGTLSLRNTYPNVEVVRVKTWDDMVKLYSELYAMKHPYRTIGIDSVTEMQKFSMRQIMKDVIKKDAERDPDIPSVREWGKSIEQIRRVIQGFRDLPMHTIFTALAVEDKDDSTGKTAIKPALPGKLAAQVAAFPDILAYLYIKRTKTEGEESINRLLLTTATDKVMAKDRTGQLDPVIVDPTMATISESIFKGESTK